MRSILTVLAFAALAACSPAVPDSASGVGFDDYDAYLREKQEREAALTGNALPPAQAVSGEALADDGAPLSATAPSDDASALAADAQAALANTQPSSGDAVLPADPGTPAPRTVEGSLGISSENDFEAVGAQRSIESDAQLIEQNRAQYQVIQPTALPSRASGSEPNIVQYALNSTHPVGAKVYSRSGFSGSSKYGRNCARYASSDLAQADFLEKGGPSRDKLGLDPDGDGYACAWDPAPFRKAVSRAGGA